MKLPKYFGQRMYRFTGEPGSKAGQGMHELHRVVAIYPLDQGFDSPSEVITTNCTAPTEEQIEVVTWGQKRMSWLGTLAEFWRQFEEVAA